MIGQKRLAENRRKAEATGRELDKLGRLRSGPSAVNGEWERQKHTDENGRITYVERRVPVEENRCTAKIVGKENPWRGNRCTALHIKGARVCKVHGGSLPNVKKAAQRRLAMAADPAAARLIFIALEKKRVSDSDRIRALLAVLDLAGIQGKQTIEIELKPWQAILQKVYGHLDDGNGTIELEEGVDYTVDEDTDEWDEDDDGEG